MPSIVDIPVPKGKKDGVYTYAVLSDIHGPHEVDIEAYKVARKAISQFKNLRVILLGDVIDLAWCHKSNPAYKQALKNKDVEGYLLPEWEDELTWYKWLIDDLNKLDNLKEIFISAGNHEQRVERGDFQSAIDHVYKPHFSLQKKLGIDNDHYINYNDYFRLKAKQDSLYFTHGAYHGTTYLKKSYESVRSNIIMGHLHKREMKAFTGFDTQTSYANPCLCEIANGPSYLQGKLHDWVQGFSLIHVDYQNIFVNVYEIKNGKCYF